MLRSAQVRARSSPSTTRTILSLADASTTSSSSSSLYPAIVRRGCAWRSSSHSSTAALPYQQQQRTYSNAAPDTHVGQTMSGRSGAITAMHMMRTFPRPFHREAASVAAGTPTSFNSNGSTRESPAKVVAMLHSHLHPPPSVAQRRRGSHPAISARDGVALWSATTTGDDVSFTSPATRSMRFETYQRLLHHVVEGRAVEAEALLHHPDAPAPAVVLEQILQHRVPSTQLVELALLHIIFSRHNRHRSSSATAVRALERVSVMLREGGQCSALHTLYHSSSLRALLVEALLRENITAEALRVVAEMPDAAIPPRLWATLMEYAAQGKVPHTDLLWRLLRTTPSASVDVDATTTTTESSSSSTIITRAGESARLSATLGATASPRVVDEMMTYSIHARGFDVRPSCMPRSPESSHDGAEVHVVALSKAEMGYALEHFSGAAGDVAGDDRALHDGSLRLYASMAAYHLSEEVDGANDASSSSSSPRASLRAAAMTMGLHGVSYGLDAKTASELLLRCGSSFGGQASPMLAVNIIQRYLRTCEILRMEAAATQAAIDRELSLVERWKREGVRSTSSSSSPTAAMSSSNKISESSESRDSTSSWTKAELTTAEGASSRLVALRTARARILKAAQPHPAPFQLLFRILRDAREVVAPATPPPPSSSSTTSGDATLSTNASSSSSSSQPMPMSRQSAVVVVGDRGEAVPIYVSHTTALPMLHWAVAWRYFQRLNRDNTTWFELISPEDAAEMCRHVMEILCRGAAPWMSLNVARRAAAAHIVDGLEVSLWLLHRLDPSHHTEEARQVARKVFRWMLADVGIHLHAHLHPHLIPAARVLIRLGLQDELTNLHNAIIDNAYSFGERFRHEFITVMEDLMCPSCSSMLPHQDLYATRCCPTCLAIIPAKDARLAPSYQLAAEHVERIRERRRARREKTRQRVRDGVMQMEHGSVGQPLGRRSSSSSSSMDAATRLQRALLADVAPLLPGVGVATRHKFISEGGDDASALDLRAAMEESAQRLKLQAAARQYALSGRGTGPVEAALPSSAGLLAASSLAGGATPAWLSASTSSPSFSAASVRGDGAWNCVWCQEPNTSWSSRVQCAACGAETGPTAPWRTFSYAAPGDILGEVRVRIANADERPVEAVVAAYQLMVFRRSYLLRAATHDHERLERLIMKLCELHERVLAGYLYCRLLPPPLRRTNDALRMLAQLFGGAESVELLTEADLRIDERFFPAVFTPTTCKVCFGTHDWQACPLVTRNFRAGQHTAINLSPEEKQRAILQHLHRSVKEAVEHGRHNVQLVVAAYAALVASPFRELFAQRHARSINDLTILLCECRQYRRAAFLLCHVPLHARSNEAYLTMAHYFNVTEEEAMELLGKRNHTSSMNDDDGEVVAEEEDGTHHPNFVQVMRTCCMCLDGQHASFSCPRLATWLKEILQRRRATTRGALVDAAQDEKHLRRLKTQVDGWTTAGPERLHAFYRFLLEKVELLRPNPLHEKKNDDDDDGDDDGYGGAVHRHDGLSDPLIYAINKAITKLASVGQHSHAYRLYAQCPADVLLISTTSALLRINGFSEVGIHALLRSPCDDASSPRSNVNEDAPIDANAFVASPAARAVAVPTLDRCLLCLAAGHAFLHCPELVAEESVGAKLQRVADHVGGITCSTDGITAAAAYIYHTYNQGRLTSEVMRENPSLVQSMLRLVLRCFAARQLVSGVRILRRIPVEMVAPTEEVYAALWRAAGLSDDVVASRVEQLLALYDSEGIRPSVHQPPPRTTYSTRFMSGLSHLLHHELCRHCYEHGHSLATCSLFHNEVSFGRDYLAAYRMSMMSEQLDRDWQSAYLVKLVDFSCAHQLFMPYHIAGVANALNAISAMLCFRGEPGIALEHILRLPASYRRRQAFKHILHTLQMPPAEIAQLLNGFYFSPDELRSTTSSSPTQLVTANNNSNNNNNNNHHAGSGEVGGGGGVMAQHLLIPKPAIKDVAMKRVFGNVPAALAALEAAPAHMEIIRKRGGASPRRSGSGTATTTTSSSSSSSSMRVMQGGDVLRLREDFDAVLTELEEAVGMRLGSRHVLFTNAMEVLSAGGGATEQKREHKPPTTTVVMEKTQVHVRAATPPTSSSRADVGQSAKADATNAPRASSSSSSPNTSQRRDGSSPALNRSRRQRNQRNRHRQDNTRPPHTSSSSQPPGHRDGHQQQQQHPRRHNSSTR